MVGNGKGLEMARSHYQIGRHEVHAQLDLTSGMLTHISQVFQPGWPDRYLANSQPSKKRSGTGNRRTENFGFLMVKWGSMSSCKCQTWLKHLRAPQCPQRNQCTLRYIKTNYHGYTPFIPWALCTNFPTS